VGSERSPRLAAAQQARALAYWTPARMRNARPAPMPKPDRAAPRMGPSVQEVGRARHAEALGPSDGGSGVGASPATYTYPFPFTRYATEGALYSVFPYRAVGKIFFKQLGINYVCSGASVTGGTRNVVYTAGHCVSTGASVFSTNVIFVPARRNGAEPYGRFAATQLWTTSAWHTTHDFTYDVGAFSVGLNALRQTLRSRVGALGFAWNQSRDQHWNDFGYPAAAPFTGETLQVCQASHGTDDLSVPGVGPDPLGIGCDQTGGSSGGPWILGLKSKNWLNGVNSYKYLPSQSLAMYGPYFDNAANNVRCAAGTGNASATSC
jgi:V8-like Glu-specific endopeptidase